MSTASVAAVQERGQLLYGHHSARSRYPLPAAYPDLRDLPLVPQPVDPGPSYLQSRGGQGWPDVSRTSPRTGLDLSPWQAGLQYQSQPGDGPVGGQQYLGGLDQLRAGSGFAQEGAAYTTQVVPRGFPGQAQPRVVAGLQFPQGYSGGYDAVTSAE